jgi:hypothetical protein
MTVKILIGHERVASGQNRTSNWALRTLVLAQADCWAAAVQYVCARQIRKRG